MKSFTLISLLLSLFTSNFVLGGYNIISEPSWTEQKMKALEAAVQRAGCQEYLAHGYRYEHMYRIDGVAFDNTVVKTSNGDLIEFEMHIAIKAEKDGIILLSPTANPGSNDLVYEIGVGIAVNKYTVLRITKDSGNEVARVSTSDILSPKKYTKFFIKISDGVLTFGKEGEQDSPIISYSDIRLKTVKYFDLSSWGVIDGKFLYDCPGTDPIY